MRRKLKTTFIPMVAALSMLLGPSGAAAASGARDQKPDETIQAMVVHRLDEHHLSKGGNIQVSVKDHQVILSGTVETLAQKRKAEEQAREVDDAVQVNNQLTVKVEDLSDQQIAENVGKAIRSYVFYDIYDWVSGNVQKGVLTLTGSAHLPWGVRDYERLAEGVGGVKEIHNQIQTLPTSDFDDQLRVQLARAIYGSPWLDRYAIQPYPPIHIIVDNGRITLEGVVDSQMDRTIAEQVARSRVLAFDVVNHLQVGNRG